MMAPNGPGPTPPAWARARAQIGQIATGATENRAALDRVRVRWIALKRDVNAESERLGAEAPAAWTRFADEFRQQFETWEAFYRDEYDNLMGDLWPLSDLNTEIERWEATLTAYTSRYRELSTLEPSGVTTATTAPRAPLGPPAGTGDTIGDSIRWVAIAAIVVGVAWVASSGASVATAIAPAVPRRVVRA